MHVHTLLVPSQGLLYRTKWHEMGGMYRSGHGPTRGPPLFQAAQSSQVKIIKIENSGGARPTRH